MKRHSTEIRTKDPEVGEKIEIGFVSYVASSGSAVKSQFIALA